MAKPKWTPDQIEFVRHKYQFVRRADIAPLFQKRFKQQINDVQLRGIIYKNNIHVVDIVKKNAAARKNAGIFKPGKSRNTRPIGTTHLRDGRYLFIKIAHPNVWQLLHHYVFEQHHGRKIKKNHVLKFIDDSLESIMNPKAENLIEMPRSAIGIYKSKNASQHNADLKKLCIYTSILESRIKPNGGTLHENF